MTRSKVLSAKVNAGFGAICANLALGKCSLHMVTWSHGHIVCVYVSARDAGRQKGQVARSNLPTPPSRKALNDDLGLLNRCCNKAANQLASGAALIRWASALVVPTTCAMRAGQGIADSSTGSAKYQAVLQDIACSSNWLVTVKRAKPFSNGQTPDFRLGCIWNRALDACGISGKQASRSWEGNGHRTSSKSMPLTVNRY